MSFATLPHTFSATWVLTSDRVLSSLSKFTRFASCLHLFRFGLKLIQMGRHFFLPRDLLEAGNPELHPPAQKDPSNERRDCPIHQTYLNRFVPCQTSQYHG